MKKIIILFLISLSIFSESKWKRLSKEERIGAEKEFEIEKKSKTLKEKFSFTKEIIVPYSGCGEDFPKMIGEFPCSFLSDEHSIKKSVEDVNRDSADGGRIGIRVSKEKNLLGGKVFLVGDDPKEDGSKNEDHLEVYYLKNNYISHYKYKNYLVLFKWVGEKSSESLISIFVIRYDKGKVFSSKRIDFK